MMFKFRTMKNNTPGDVATQPRRLLEAKEVLQRSVEGGRRKRLRIRDLLCIGLPAAQAAVVGRPGDHVVEVHGHAASIGCRAGADIGALAKAVYSRGASTHPGPKF